MNPEYQRIADLFGLSVPGVDVKGNSLPSRRKIGTDSAESSALGGQSLSEGDYEAAIAHFRRAIEQGSRQEIAHLVDLGGAYEVADLEPQALRQYRTALKVRADAAEPHLGLAELYKRSSRRRDAIQELQEALEREPENAFILHKLAELYADLGYRELALAAEMRAVAAAPTDSFYHYRAGDLLLELGRADEALAAFRAAVELSPGDDHLFLRTTVAFWALGRLPEAIRSIQLASELDPEKLVYFGVLAYLYDQNEQADEAEAAERTLGRMDRYDRDLLARILDEIRRLAPRTS